MKKPDVKRESVKVLPYSALWPLEFLEEKRGLKKIFKDSALKIEHIGSTSIPGLPAKPLIDIAILVENIEVVDILRKELTASGYKERVGRLAGRQLVFVKGIDENVTHHLHIIEMGEEDWDDKILFREALLSNKELCSAYESLKYQLLENYEHDRLQYTTGKTNFIKEVLAKYKTACNQ